MHNFNQQSAVQFAKFQSLLDKHIHSPEQGYGHQFEILKQQHTPKIQALIIKNNEALDNQKSQPQVQMQF